MSVDNLKQSVIEFLSSKGTMTASEIYHQMRFKHPDTALIIKLDEYMKRGEFVDLLDNMWVDNILLVQRKHYSVKKGVQ